MATKSSKQKKAITSAVKSTKGQSASAQISAINKAISSTGGLSGGGSKSSSSSSSNPYGQFGSLENLQSFVSSVRGVPDTDVATINKALKNSGITNFTYTPTIGANELMNQPIVPTLPNLAIPSPIPSVGDINKTLGADANGLFQQIPTAEAEQLTTAEKLSRELGIDVPEEPESSLDIFKKAQKELRIKEKQQAVNDLQAQLNTLTAQSQAQQLALEGQGRGQTTQFLGGEQARIQREAAIAALPIQAQLTAAQGNLETATTLLNQYVTLATADATNRYNYKMKLFDVAYQIASTEQQRKIEDKRREEDRQFQIKMENIKFNNDAALQNIALQNKMAYDTFTSAQTPTISPYSQERAIRTVQSVDELKLKAQQNKGIFGRTAALPLPQFARSADFRNFKSELDTLKSNIAFNELTAMREASKTGGALGQVSDREGKLLESSLGALEMSQSPENFIIQLNKIKESINRWNRAVSGQGLGYTTTAPDGTLVEITD